MMSTKAKLTHWVVRGATVLVVALAANLENTRASAADVSGSFDEGACVLQCATGGPTGCYSGTHSAWVSDIDRDGGGVAHYPHCFSGTCAAAHPCTPLPDGPAATLGFDESVARAIENADAMALATLIDVEASNVTLNTERAAFQVLSCTGAVTAHLPADSALIAATVRTLNQLN